MSKDNNTVESGTKSPSTLPAVGPGNGMGYPKQHKQLKRKKKREEKHKPLTMNYIDFLNGK